MSRPASVQRGFLHRYHSGAWPRSGTSVRYRALCSVGKVGSHRKSYDSDGSKCKPCSPCAESLVSFLLVVAIPLLFHGRLDQSQHPAFLVIFLGCMMAHHVRKPASWPSFKKPSSTVDCADTTNLSCNDPHSIKKEAVQSPCAMLIQNEHAASMWRCSCGGDTWGAALWAYKSVERKTDKCCCASVEGRWVNGNSKAQEKRAKRRKKKLVFLLLHLPLVLLDTTTQARTKHIDFCLRQETVAPVSVVCEICLCHRC